MIWYVLVAIAAVLALAYVIAPMRGRHLSSLEEGDADATQELNERKRAALLGIVDVEEEAGLGKLSDADVAELTARYEAEALEALRSLETVPHLATTDAALEAEIAAVRARLTCSSCGALRATGGRCASCGAS